MKNLFKKNDPKNFNAQDLHNESESYLEIASFVKEARIKKDLSIEDLSLISRIPKRIINAIENNDDKVRPKYPFIRSILFKLEDCLSMKKSSLVDLLVKEKKISKKNTNFLVRNFDLINTWEGSILYLLILILSLFILKRYFFYDVNIINIQTIEEKIN